MTDWAAVPCISFDLETTGVDPFTDRIVQAACVKIVPGQDRVVKTWLVDPGVEIPEEAAAVHGITTERARAEATHTTGELLSEVSGILARTMQLQWATVVMNAPFDLTMLEAENQRQGLGSLASLVYPLPIGPIVDPMVLDRHVDPYRKNICAESRNPCSCGATDKKLTSLAKHYRVPLVDAHDPAADATAAGLIWPAIVARYPQHFRGLSLGGLHVAQIGWRKHQMDGLRDYFDRNQIEHDGCDPAWPLRTEPSTTTPQEQLIP